MKKYQHYPPYFALNTKLGIFPSIQILQISNRLSGLPVVSQKRTQISLQTCGLSEQDRVSFRGRLRRRRATVYPLVYIDCLRHRLLKRRYSVILLNVKGYETFSSVKVCFTANIFDSTKLTQCSSCVYIFYMSELPNLKFYFHSILYRKK